VQSFDLEKLYLTRLVGGTAWSPDGRQIVFVTNISGRNNLWFVPATGGWQVQFTVSNQRQSAPAWSPVASPSPLRLITTAMNNGTLSPRPTCGEVVNLPKQEHLGRNPVWSPDGVAPPTL
jgi:TolB protein